MRLLAVKPLLYVIAALLAAVMLLATRSCVQSAGARTAEAQREAADNLVARVRTERDAWKRHAESNAANAEICARSLQTLTDEYQRQQRDHAVLDAQREAAIVTAETEARAADRALKQFTAQFQADARTGTCGAALAALNNACPSLRDY